VRTMVLPPREQQATDITTTTVAERVAIILMARASKVL
jgi:hypothetical protein